MKARKSLENFSEYDYPKTSRKDYLRLDFGENLNGCSKKVIERLKKVTARDISTYPEYDVRKKTAEFLKINPKNLILTNGSDDAIRLIMEAYLGKEDEILLIEPSFTMFEFYAKLREAKIRKVLLNNDLSFPESRFLDAIDENTKMVVLCSPNNPTGTLINRQAIIEVLKKTKGIVLIDEAYFEFCSESVIDLIEEYENLVITRTFSKSAGLAGLRIGVAIGNEDIIKELKKICSPFAVNSLACLALDAAIKDWRFVDGYVEEIKKSKKYLYEELSYLGIKTYPTSANFFIADFGKSVKKVCSILEKKGILIRDRSDYPLLSGCARITIGTQEQSRYFISQLKEVLYLLELDTLLFDMDGVLVDVSDSYRVAIKQTAEYFMENKQISFEQIQAYKEKGGLNNDWDCTRAILKDNGIDKTREEIREKFDSIYLGGIIDNEKMIVDLKLLYELSKKYNLGLITGRPRRDADYTIKKFCLDRYFSSIITMDDEEKKSDGISKVLIKFNSKKAVYLGDTIDDMNSAKEAGIICIGIIPPSASKDTKKMLCENGASVVLKTINELREVLR